MYLSQQISDITFAISQARRPILLAGNKNMKVNKNNPIVISTWSHGMPANEVSMKILKKKSLQHQKKQFKQKLKH